MAKQKEDDKIIVPESLVIETVKTELSNIINKYPLRITTWKLLLDNFIGEINSAYNKQLMKDRSEYIEQQEKVDRKKENEEMKDGADIKKS